MSSAVTGFEFVQPCLWRAVPLSVACGMLPPRQETMPGPLAAPPTVKRGPLCLGQGVRSPAGRPAPGPRARRPPSPRGAPGPARQAAARLPPPPQRAPRRALGRPGQRARSISRARHVYERQACLQLCSTSPCPMLPHAEHVQPSRSQSVAYNLCGTRLGRCSQMLNMHSRLRACLPSSARSCASASAKRCSAAASTSSSASVRASNT